MTPVETRQRRRMRMFLLARLVFLALALVAVFVLHFSAGELVALHVVRIVLIALMVLVMGSIGRRRR